jgi:hypothetical protein
MAQAVKITARNILVVEWNSQTNTQPTTHMANKWLSANALLRQAELRADKTDGEIATGLYATGNDRGIATRQLPEAGVFISSTAYRPILEVILSPIQ